MKTKKKIAIMLVSVFFLMSSMPVWGAVEESPEWYDMKEETFSVQDDGQEGYAIIPRSKYIGTVHTGISKLGSGKLGLWVDVHCVSTVSSIKTVFDLQKLINNSWTTVSRGTASTANSNSMSKTMSVSGVSAGTYRTKTSTTVSNGSYSESATGYSGSITIS